MYNKELVVLAKKLGFESNFFSDQPWKHSTRESMRYQLWLEELKQWILDNHKIYVEVIETQIVIPDGNFINIIQKGFTFNILNKNNILKRFMKFDSYIEALDSGIYKTLEYIESNNNQNN